MPREVEYNSLSAASFECGKVRLADKDYDDPGRRSATRPWNVVTTASAAGDPTTGTTRALLDCTYSSPPEASIRIPPMGHRLVTARGSCHHTEAPSPTTPTPPPPLPRWSSTQNFHPFLHFPASRWTDSTRRPDNHSGVCVVLEARAREGLAVALSPDTRFCRGHTYEVYFGHVGNTRTTLRYQRQPRTRRAGGGGDGDSGGGGNGGDTQQPPSRNNDKPANEGDANETNGHKQKGGPDTKTTMPTEASSKTASETSSTMEISFPSRVCQERAWKSFWVCLSRGRLLAGVGPVPGQQCIVLLDVHDETSAAAAGDDVDDNHADEAGVADQPSSAPSIRFVGLGNTGLDDRQPAAPLHVRNVRLTHVPASLADHLSTLTLDALELVLADDQDDEETRRLMKQYQNECRKARARAEKFGMPYTQPPPPDLILPWSDARRLRANPSAGFVTGFDLSDPTEQAKVEARRKRFGVIPMEATAESVPAVGETEPSSKPENKSEESISVDQAWDKEALTRALRTDPPSSLWKVVPPEPEDRERSFATESQKPTYVPEKIHLFAIDWAAFKQIRTQDVMAYFKIYGPTYVEWLGDLSCNVLFEDRFTASRALENLSTEIPSPPPDEVVLAAINREIDAAADDSDAVADIAPPDFGNMSWRIGKKALRKISNDRYGRRGTSARILLRLATSLDVLMQRPKSWPKPPAGFTTKRVLGPESDNPHVRLKRGRSDGKNDAPSGTAVSSEDHPLLSRGLKAGRLGFSVEDLESERARKRTKVLEEEEGGDS